MDCEDKSRLSHAGTSSSGYCNHKDAMLGCAQRIASATEAMAKRHTELMSERDAYFQMYQTEYRMKERLLRKVAAQKGVVTKYRRKIAELKEQITEMKSASKN